MLNLDLNNFDKKKKKSLERIFFFFNALFFFFFYFPILEKPGSHCQAEGTLLPSPCIHGTQHAVLAVVGMVQLGTVKFSPSLRITGPEESRAGVKPRLGAKPQASSTMPLCLPAPGAGVFLSSERFITLVIMNLKCIGSELPS